MNKVLKRTSFFILGLFAVFAVSADPVINGSFETGDFTGWDRIGHTKIKKASFRSGPTDGDYQALLTTRKGSVSGADLESFLDLTPGALGSLVGGKAVEGSAIKQSINVTAGDVISFDANFLTNESTPSFFNDSAFFVSFDVGTLIADTKSSFIPSPTVFRKETGFINYSVVAPTSSSSLLGFGLVDLADKKVVSGLLIDNVYNTSAATAVPEPSEYALICAGLICLVGAQYRRKRTKCLC